MSATARPSFDAPFDPNRARVPAAHGGRRLPLVGLGLAAVGSVASAVLARGQLTQFYYSYLTAFLFFLSIALGALFFVICQFVTRAGWSVVLRRLAENVMGALPVFVVLFVPIALGLHDLFHWAHKDAVAADELLQHKAPYLNPTFFLIRAAAYLLLWTALSTWLRRQSVQQDVSKDPELTRRLQVASAPAVIVFALTITFAAFDWIMSLDPHWYSTIFGVYYYAGSVVALFAVLILMASSMSRAGLLAGAVTVEHFHDLGKLLFAFVAFWAYIAFSQYFLIWYANIPEETIWFLQRWEGGWRELSVVLAVGHFVIPFFFLLPRAIKRRQGTLVLAAIWMLAMHYLDIYWLVMPNLHPQGAHGTLLDASTFLAIGGVVIAVVGYRCNQNALVPIGDPRLAESLSFENT